MDLDQPERPLGGVAEYGLVNGGDLARVQRIICFFLLLSSCKRPGLTYRQPFSTESNTQDVI